MPAVAKGPLTQILRIVLLAGVYYAVARVGLSVAALPGNVAPIWPPTGLAIAAVFVFGPSVAPGVFIGALLVNHDGLPIAVALMMAAGNTLESLVGAAFLKRFNVRPTLSHPRDVGVFVFFVAGAATLVSATIGVLALRTGGVIPTHEILSHLKVWWAGDALGALVVTPLLLACRRRPAGHEYGGTRIELIALTVAMSVSVALTFYGAQRLAFVIYPLVAWAALRFGGRGASCATFVVAFIAVDRTAAGVSRFATGHPVSDLLALDAFLAVLAFTGMLLAAVVSERDRMQRELRQVNALLEARVTERTEALRVDRERLAEAQRIAHIGSFEWDVDRDVISWSDEMLRLFGFDRATAPDEFAGAFARVHPDDLADASSVVQDVLAQGQPYATEFRVLLPDGAVRWLHAEGRCRVVDGRVTRVNGICQDITERQTHKDTLAVALDEAREASRLKTAFLANMSHEIRTPMNGVMGMLGLLLETELDATQQDYVETIATSAEALTLIINDVLDVSKIEAGKLTLDSRSFALHTLIEDTVSSFVPAARDKGIILSGTIGDDVPATIFGDRLRLRQVVANLLSNAVKFTEAGSVELVVRVDSWSLVFEVLDTGIGIPADTRARLFEPFVQADESTTRRFGGTGLGLAICRQLATLMNGEIGVAGRESGGSRFWFKIPLKFTAVEVEERASHRPAATPLANGHVLVVEDNAVNRKVAVGMLENLGYTASIAVDGVAAVEAFTTDTFDIVLMDCQMPRMDGYDATRAMRALEGDRHTPIVAMTASAMASDRDRCLAAGMDDYLAKPVNKETLAEVLRHCCEAAEPKRAG